MERSKLVFPPELERSHGGLRARKSIDESALELLAELRDLLGVADLGSLHCVDVGCGVKFTRALINRGIPIGRYVGIDVAPPVVAALRQLVEDDRFEFAHLDVHNARYNPSGARMSRDMALPVGKASFDVVLGYSLFTHLDPDDFGTMLSLMRAVARPDGRLVFTVFLDQHSAGGLGFVDKYSEGLGGSIQGLAAGSYVDVFEDDPLRVALYDLELVGAMLEAEGWRMLEVRDPTEYSQHTVLAATAAAGSA